MIFSYSNDWVFQFTGLQFPVGNVFLNFSGPASIYVDYGNGTGATFTSGTANRIFFGTDDTSNASANYPRYLYSTGSASSLRTVRIRINQPELLVGLQVNGALNRPQPFPVKFSRFVNLQSVGLSGMSLTDIDTSLLQLKNLTLLSFRGAFSKDTRFYGFIPDYVFSGKKYLTFGWQAALGGKSFSVSNLDKLAVHLGATLDRLILDSNSLADTNGVDGALPENFSGFGLLSYLALNNNLYTTFPALINGLISLTTLEFGSNPLVSWGNLSGLTSLNTLNVSSSHATSLPASVPAYFTHLTALKVFSFMACFGNAAGLEAFIGSFYSFVVSNAALSGPASLPFRNMRITCGDVVVGSGFIVSGVEKAPDGYVQGSSNGTPANAAEMIYVMKNQYSHTWIYRGV